MTGDRADINAPVRRRAPAARARIASLAVVVLAATACANWSQFRGSEARTGFQPFESSIDSSNVSTLHERWRADLGSNTEDSGSQRFSPTVASGVVYVGRYDSLLAFDAAGTKSCSGTPRTCSPLWRYPTDAPVITSSPAVVNGIVYLGSGGKLYAFDAVGTTGCSGAPKVCAPLWTATGAFAYSSVAVANGIIYLGTYDGHLDAFDAAGQSGCSGVPKTCAPLWTASAGTSVEAAPAVANGAVYVASTDGKLYAFDASGQAGCSGMPKTCTPRWTAATSGSVTATPAVAAGIVYVGSHDHRLYAFGASGTTGCSGVPKTCTALWTAETGDVIRASPAVAYGTVYINGPSAMSAFDATGTNRCSGSPKSCLPLWTTTPATPGYPSGASPAVANGVVYADSVKNDLAAFDAAGTKSCTGPTPKTCSPLWTSPNLGESDAAAASPSIANGIVYTVYFESNSFQLRAYAR